MMAAAGTEKVKKKRRWFRVILKLGVLMFFMGLLLSAVSFSTFYGLETTKTNEFCGQCHEMEPFVTAWEHGPHGIGPKGVVRAQCVDCHLPSPEATPMSYILTKARLGINDSIQHYRTGGVGIDWEGKLEHHGDYLFSGGCKRCHKTLVAPEISLKAYHAHKAFELGETEKICVDCHFTAGHGDLRTVIREAFGDEETQTAHQVAVK